MTPNISHHNHRALLWYSGAWGRCLPTSIVRLVLPAPCLQLISRIRDNNCYHEKHIITKEREKPLQYKAFSFVFRDNISVIPKHKAKKNKICRHRFRDNVFLLLYRSPATRTTYSPTILEIVIEGFEQPVLLIFYSTFWTIFPVPKTFITRKPIEKWSNLPYN